MSPTKVIPSVIYNARTEVVKRKRRQINKLHKSHVAAVFVL